MSKERLRRLIDEAEGQFGSNDFKGFWATIGQINELMQNVQLAPQSYHEIRDWQNDRCERAKQQMAAKQRAYKEDSAGKRKLVETTIRQAMSTTTNAESSQDLARAIELLKQASERMKVGYSAGFDLSYSLTTHEGRLTREDREQCNELWREARNGIESRRQEIHDRNYRHFAAKASRAYNEAHAGNGREAKDLVKEIQAEMKGVSMSGDQFQIIRDQLDKAWQSAVSHQRAKHEEWERKTRDFIERMKALIDKNENVIARIEGQIDHCEGLLATARGDDFASQVQGWIDEKRRKIEDIQETNREVSAKIRDAESKLSN